VCPRSTHSARIPYVCYKTKVCTSPFLLRIYLKLNLALAPAYIEEKEAKPFGDLIFRDKSKPVASAYEGDAHTELDLHGTQCTSFDYRRW
jgi:hypothetical protein